MDARCAPQRVPEAHLPNQSADLTVNRWPPNASARFPAAVGSKAPPVPADHGLGPDNPDGAQDRRKESVRPDQHKTIRIRQPQSLRQLADEDIELLAQDEIHGFEPGARFEPKAQRVRASCLNHSIIGRQNTRFGTACHSDRIPGNDKSHARSAEWRQHIRSQTSTHIAGDNTAMVYFRLQQPRELQLDTHTRPTLRRAQRNPPQRRGGGRPLRRQGSAFVAAALSRLEIRRRGYREITIAPLVKFPPSGVKPVPAIAKLLTIPLP